MATICGKDLTRKGIGTVSCTCTDDEGKIYTNKFSNVLYFTDSPLNILSATEMAESMKDDEVTWVLT